MIFFLFCFSENNTQHFIQIASKGDNLKEMPSLEDPDQTAGLCSLNLTFLVCICDKDFFFCSGSINSISLSYKSFNNFIPCNFCLLNLLIVCLVLRGIQINNTSDEKPYIVGPH